MLGFSQQTADMQHALVAIIWLLLAYLILQTRPTFDQAHGRQGLAKLAASQQHFPMYPGCLHQAAAEPERFIVKLSPLIM